MMGMPDRARGEDWSCAKCMEGVQCNGGTVATMRVLPGWFATRHVDDAGKEQRLILWPCPDGVIACPGNASVASIMTKPIGRRGIEGACDTFDDVLPPQDLDLSLSSIVTTTSSGNNSGSSSDNIDNGDSGGCKKKGEKRQSDGSCRSCMACPAGTYFYDGWTQNRCEQCPAGHTGNKGCYIDYTGSEDTNMVSACSQATNTTYLLSLPAPAWSVAARAYMAPQCQCGPGYTGLLCRACKSSSVHDLPSWHNGSGKMDYVRSGGKCVACKMSRGDATALMAIVTFALLFIAGAIGCCVWRLIATPYIEERFVKAFSSLAEADGNPAHIIDSFFGEGSRHGVSQDVFVERIVIQLAKKRLGRDPSFHKRAARGLSTAATAVMDSPRRLQRAMTGHGGREHGTNPLTRQVYDLWDKLDENGDGEVTLDEFVSFFYHVKKGQKSTNK